MICRAIPYEGHEPHIFLSYCHKDSDRVYPLLEQMAREGYRIWYDDGNHAGDDWLESIAQHLNDCSVCLAMISENSAASHNCKSEINEAIAWGKKLVAVLLEDFQMPLGMRLQLSTIQYLKRPDYPSDWMLLQKLCETEALAACKSGTDGASLRDIHSEAKAGEEVPQDNNPAAAGGIPDAAGEQGICVEEEQIATLTVPRTRLQSVEPEEPKAAEEQEVPVLLSLHRRHAWLLTADPTRIGRSSKRCDVVISNNAYIGNCHAEIGRDADGYYLQDLNSSNGTYDGEEKLPSGSRVPLRNEAEFRLYNESFLFLCNDTARQIAALGGGFFLMNTDSREMYPVLRETTYLDRGHKWKGGTLNDKLISRSQHAAVIIRDNRLWLKDLGSHNGTYLNGQRIQSLELLPLSIKDEIRLGSTVLEVGMITLQGDNE